MASFTPIIIKSARRTAVIEIKQNGDVVVRVPRSMETVDINRFIERSEKKIERYLNRLPKNENVQKLTDKEKKNLATSCTEKFLPRVEYFADVMGVSFSKITFRAQKTRWGSCSKDGNISLNILLYYLDESLSDYIIVHELSHRKQMNHSKKFWENVEKILPDYRDRRKKLRQTANNLFIML